MGIGTSTFSVRASVEMAIGFCRRVYSLLHRVRDLVMMVCRASVAATMPRYTTVDRWPGKQPFHHSRLR